MAVKSPRRAVIRFGHGQASFQICADDIEKLLGRFCIERAWMLIGIYQMRAHVIFDDFGHEAGHRPACAGEEVHDLFAVRLIVERPLNCLDLPPDTAHARQELVLLADGVRHEPYRIAPHPIFSDDDQKVAES
jgi:hypothetical protein